MQSTSRGDVLGVGLARLALAVCMLLALVILLPAGLAWIGFSAIVGGIEHAAAPAAPITSTASAEDRNQTQSSTSSPPVSAGSGTRTLALATHGLIAGWAERGPLDQYARSNYQSDASWLDWRDAGCSAAALDWLLGAYGQPLGSIDQAIGLIGPSTGISDRIGLVDARGPALAGALAGRGLPARQPHTSDGRLRPLSSRVELEAWLSQGPLLMDGARWFGKGHWFVGIGYDAGGIDIRDSSGWDTRYLTWSRLYGEVGFSGWVVGVAT